MPTKDGLAEACAKAKRFEASCRALTQTLLKLRREIDGYERDDYGFESRCVGLIDRALIEGGS